MARPAQEYGYPLYPEFFKGADVNNASQFLAGPSDDELLTAGSAETMAMSDGVTLGSWVVCW